MMAPDERLKRRYLSLGQYNERMGVLSPEEWALLIYNRVQKSLKTGWKTKKRIEKLTLYPSDLTIEWILAVMRLGCPRTGYQWFNGQLIPANRQPSVDRIDSTFGYTKDNTQIVVRQYNVAKNVWSDYDTIEMARAIVRVADLRIQQ